MTNFKLVATLEEVERARLAEFVKAHQDLTIVRLIEELAPLPEGLSHLHGSLGQNDGRTKP